MMDRDTVRNMQSFCSKNKVDKLVHLVGFIIRMVARTHGYKMRDAMSVVVKEINPLNTELNPICQ